MGERRQQRGTGTRTRTLAGGKGGIAEGCLYFPCIYRWDQRLYDILTNHARAMQTVELDQRVAELEACQEEVRACKRESDRFVNGGLQQFKETDNLK